MASPVRLSPVGIFFCVCTGFIVLYSAKNITFSIKSPCIDDPNVDDSVSMKELIETSIYLAEKGGAILKEIREKDNLNEKSKGFTAEGVVDPLTEGDLQSHKAIVHGFRKLFPLISVVSEEHDESSHSGEEGCIKQDPSTIKNIGGSLQGDNTINVPIGDILIWVDPLDATKEYTERLLEYVTTMVCITINGQPVAGIIHQPFLKKTAWAWVEHGHSEKLIKPSKNEDFLKNPRIIVSRSHAGHVNQTASAAFGSGVKILPAGGAGFKVLSLFNNEADAYVHNTLIKKWDICAGDALLRSFGGKMTTLEGKEISYGDRLLVKNSGGLLATLSNHEQFLSKLSATNDNGT